MMILIKKWKFPIIIGSIFLLLLITAPDTAQRSLSVSSDYFLEMVLIFPPVFILMGLMDVWISKDRIQKWLGDDSGIRGAVFSLILGTLPTGPLYVAFPMAAALLHKGASVANIVIFLGSWAALKIPQLMVEISFLGLPFAVLRFFLTLAALILMGAVMKLYLKAHPDEAWLASSQDQKMSAVPQQKE